MLLNRLLKRLRKFFLGYYLEIYYINGPDNLPAPLSREQETAIFMRLEEGDPKAKEILITHNLRLVVYIARKFESTGIGIEDLISIGTIGLIKAVTTFDSGKGSRLATYAARCIDNELLMHFRAKKKTSKEVSLYEPIGTDKEGNEILMYLRKIQNQKTEVSIDEPLNVDWDGNELLLSDILGTDGDTVNRELEQEVERSALRGLVSGLGEREQRIMRLRFGLDGGEERTQKEVADIIGISQSYISRLEKKIIRQLREEMQQIY